MSGVNSVYESLSLYFGNNAAMPVLLLLALAVLFYRKSDNTKRYIMLCAVSLVVIFNDLVRKILGKFTGIETYYRFFWAIPILFLIAWAMIKVVERAQGKGRKCLIALLLGVCILLASPGRIPLNAGMIPENKYNISNEVMEISEMIAADKEEEQAVIAADLGILMDLRGYDPTLIWGVRRKAYIAAGSGNWEIDEKYKHEVNITKAVCCGIQEDAAVLKKSLKKRKIDYIITQTSFGLDSYLESAGYTVVGHTATRTLYGRK